VDMVLRNGCGSSKILDPRMLMKSVQAQINVALSMSIPHSVAIYDWFGVEPLLVYDACTLSLRR
jgi:hypothetical protein